VTVDALLRCLVDRAAVLYLDGDRLRYWAPAGALTPDLRREIADQRPAIIEHLQPVTATDAVGNRCANCDQRNWVDAPPEGGRIRTTCGKCGRFIGYRPAEPRMA
jgi:hypothetical protein